MYKIRGRKLVLSKTTLRQLNPERLDEVVGGYTDTNGCNSIDHCDTDTCVPTGMTCTTGCSPTWWTTPQCR